MIAAIQDPRIQKIIALPGEKNEDWKNDLERLEAGDVTLDRKTAGEHSIRAIQRLLIFLGYSTASRGGFLIDGDFGRGTNRGVAQFQFEYGLNPKLKRNMLCYDCSWSNAHHRIVNIPDTRLDIPTLKKMLEVAIENIENKHVACGDFDEAIFQLNSNHQRNFYTCKEIAQRYQAQAENAVKRLKEQNGATVHPIWLLTIVKQETAGVITPRFEQHYLSRLNKTAPNDDFTELRYRSMSFGLGQIMGENYRKVGAPSAKAMFVSPVDEQLYHIGCFLTASPSTKAIVAKTNPTASDFRTVARTYNGSGYEAHRYHESIEGWYREFRSFL
ncbi:MAG: DUF3380 domain-containing protein [Lewinellaceae bacterium]|nr:DUF3380 domain-containing protein [Lewinellaceae bacterium]